MKKIKDILTTDIKLINSYLLILIVLVTISVTSMGTYAIFTYDKQSTNLIKMVYKYVPPAPESLDKSGANVPELATGMIPVYYDSTEKVWKKADETNSNESYKWYDYDNKMWANAVTVTSTNRATYLDDTQSPVGTAIPMSDINTMFVWIPRFKAESWEGIEGELSGICFDGGEIYYDDYTQEECENEWLEWHEVNNNPGAFTINFVDKNTSAHEAFDFGTQKLSGIWVGKFENSSDTSCSPSNWAAVGAGCNLTTIRPKILPNATSWRGAMLSTFFYDILNMKESGNQYGFDTSEDTTLDTHMMKNSEWGAVAYLTQSIYGRCSNETTCTEIGINNNSSYITGYGAPAGSEADTNNGTYETELGMNASTTGNIYGIYDMSGGSHEDVMGVYWDGTNKWSGGSTWHSGFNGCLGEECSSTYEDGVPYPEDEKYYDLYTTETVYTNAGLQHAMIETKKWYSDYSNFVSGSGPWVFRGGRYDISASAGVFNYDGNYGDTYTSVSSRISLIIN